MLFSCIYTCFCLHDVVMYLDTCLCLHAVVMYLDTCLCLHDVVMYLDTCLCLHVAVMAAVWGNSVRSWDCVGVWCHDMSCDRCDSDGSWLTEQCNDKLGVCWCVTPNGFVVPKTRVRGVAQCQWGECMLPVSVLSLSTPLSLHALCLFRIPSLSLPFFLSISHPSLSVFPSLLPTVYACVHLAPWTVCVEILIYNVFIHSFMQICIYMMPVILYFSLMTK